MNIRKANLADSDFLVTHDKHIAKQEILELLRRERYFVAEDEGDIVGWLRWNLFWDNTPFMNMLYLLENHRRAGYGSALTAAWEKEMESLGYHTMMTSSLSDESAQHFYRKRGYRDSGVLFLPGESAEIIFIKEIGI